MFNFAIFYLVISFLYGDDNNLFINAGNFSSKIEISFLVINPLNQKCGYIPKIGEVREISECSYGWTRLGDFEIGSDENDWTTLEFADNSEIILGTYTLIFYGLKDTRYWASLNLGNILNIGFEDYISNGVVKNFVVFLDPTPGAPTPVLTKLVTFQILRDDFNVAYKLNQIGDEKFVNNLIRMVDIVEKLSQKCEKIKDKIKDNKEKTKCYKPVIAILRMMMKRLEAINKLCDSKTECKPKCKQKQECDEDEVFKEFDNKYRKDTDFKDFFSEWDKEEYHKHKKTCKRYITDEALEIIATDINWLIKSFGEEVWNDYKKEHNPYIPEKYKQFFK